MIRPQASSHDIPPAWMWTFIVVVLVIGSLLRLPFEYASISGYDKPWMFGMALRLWTTNFLDLSVPWETFWLQVASHVGQFVLFPVFLAAGLNELLGIPQTAKVFQYYYIGFYLLTSWLVYAFIKAVGGNRLARVLAVGCYAFLPVAVFSNLLPQWTELTVALVLLVLFCMVCYARRPSWTAWIVANAAGGFVLIASFTALLEFATFVAFQVAYLVYLVRRGEERGKTPLRRWTARDVTLVLGPLVGLGLDLFIYWWGQQAGYTHQFGIIQYALKKVTVKATREAHILAQAGIFTQLGRTLVIYNGILFPLLAFAACGWWAWRWRRLNFPQMGLLLWVGIYLVPALLWQPHRVDYSILYFFPLVLITSIQFGQWLGRWRLVPATVAVALLFTWQAVFAGEISRNAGWVAFPVRWANWQPQGLAYDHITKRESYLHFQLDCVNRDYHLKAAGYWIRTHAPRENDLVVITGKLPYAPTAEYYFGTPWVNGSHPMPKRLFWRRWHKAFPLKVKPHTAYAQLERFIQDVLARKNLDTGEWEPYLLVPDAQLYVVVIHEMGLKEAGCSSAKLNTHEVRHARQTVVRRLGLKKVGGITSGDGQVTEVSIYSTRDMPVVTYREGYARRRFDKEYATLHSIANNVYLEMFLWHAAW